MAAEGKPCSAGAPGSLSDLSVDVRRDGRTRRLSLRIDLKTGQLRLLAPAKASSQEIERFLGRHAEWAREKLRGLPPRQILDDGAVIPFLGIDHCVRHVGEAGPPVRRVGHELHVSGKAEHVGRRLRDFLVAEARRELTRRSLENAARLGVNVAGVTVRDTRSRWGSCSPQGRLSFSWRLILMPEPMLDYVVVHEVAHLRELNHSKRFWDLVTLLYGDAAPARSWLKANGARLQRVG